MIFRSSRQKLINGQHHSTDCHDHRNTSFYETDTDIKNEHGPNCTRKYSRVILLAHLQMHKNPVRTVSILLFTAILIVTSVLQMRAFILEKQGPYDHFLTTVLWKPYYGRYCPTFSSMVTNQEFTTKKYDNSYDTSVYTELSWDCPSKTMYTEQFPQIILIGARTKDENNTFPQWKESIRNAIDHMPRLQRINTLKVSNQYASSGGRIKQDWFSADLGLSHGPLCREVKWEQRLFAVYQFVFAKLLTTYPDEQDFLIVEDDSVLVNPNAFVEEVCRARLTQLQFYSLYRSPLQWQGRRSVSCIYEHGTVAFYIRRPLMELIMNENRRRWFCRFPIDMYISKLGPWYATQQEIVAHLDGGRVGSKR